MTDSITHEQHELLRRETELRAAFPFKSGAQIAAALARSGVTLADLERLAPPIIEPDLTAQLDAGTSEIHVYYLGCGHVAWLSVPPPEAPATRYCFTCGGDHEMVVVAWEARQVIDGPAVT